MSTEQPVLQRHDGDEPVDGLDGDTQIPTGQIAHRLYALFYNKRFGLTLILLTGLVALLGVLFPQAPSGVRENPEHMKAWLENLRPGFGGWTDVLNAAGLFTAFSSPLFLTLVALLSLSIIACTTHRIPLLVQAAFHPHTKVTEDFFARARLRHGFTTSLSIDEAAEQIRKDAKTRRARVIADDRGPGANLYTDTWHWAPFGTAAAHAAFVLIILGFVITSTTGFRDEQFTLTVGRPAEVGHSTGLTAEAKSFSDTYHDDGSPKDYVTDLAVSKDGQQVARQDVRVNEPLTHDGVMFHQASFGVAAVMKVTDSSGKVLFDAGVPLNRKAKDETIDFGVVQVPGTGQELFVIGPGQGSNGVRPGQIRVEVYQPDGGQVPLGTAVLDKGGKAEVDGLTYQFEREQQYTGMIVKKDPGAIVVWIGCALLAVGTCLTMFLRHHRIWFRLTRTGDGETLVRLASPDRQDSIFARRFRQIGDRLDEAMTTQGRKPTDA